MKTNHCKNIVFISGVPGAGKTLVALKFLYNYNNYIKSIIPDEGGSIYLSGNGPLVNVIEVQIDDALGKAGLGKAYIKGTIKFKRDYMNNDKVPNYNVNLSSNLIVKGYKEIISDDDYNYEGEIWFIGELN